MLVSLLLNKDYVKRPNIFEFARIPCVNKAIKQFVEENNLREEVINIFDMDAKTDSKDKKEIKGDSKNKSLKENGGDDDEEEEKIGYF